MQPAASAQPTGMRPSWLSNPTLFLCVAGVVLPNTLSLGALVMGIGAPPRTIAIVTYAAVALSALIVPRLLTVVLYLAVAIYDAIATIALLFNLAPGEVGLALHLSAELNLLASPLYVGLCASLAVLVAVNIAALTLKRDALRRGNVVVLMSAALALAAADFVANRSAHYHFGALYGAGQPMESAADSSGFNEAVMGPGERNALVVMVEALGHLAEPQQEAFLLQAFADPELRKRYDVSTGTTTYYGSTTAAELRELCDTRESLARMTADIPPTDILIVGDHAPPIWSKAGRRLFTPGKVPWVRLTPRDTSRLSGLRRD